MTLSEIQQRLRAAIKDSGIEQKEIARLLGVSPQTVSKYMCKDIFPALDMFSKLCEILDVSADDILGLKR